MKVEKFIPSEFAANNYLVYNEKTLSAALFDPCCCFYKVKDFIEEKKLNLKYLIVTHVHFDHVGDIQKYQNTFKGVKTLVPKDDEILYNNLVMQCDMFGVRRVDDFSVDEFIDEQSEIFLDDVKIEIISTPGHSKGSSCYLIEDNLISGDTLFYEEIGRCDLPTGSFSDISYSIKEKLFNLDEKTKVFTGHGENTTIAHEKENNAYFGKNSIY